MKKNNLIIMILAVSLLQQPAVLHAQDYKVQKTGLYNDIMEQNVFYELTQPLRLNRLYRLIFNKKVRAANVNAFDEVGDSDFFVNRHARKALSQDELKKGAATTDGPKGKLKVFKGKSAGLHPGFFVKDENGDRFLLKFDDYDYLELTTGAEVVASRFYHAIGYHVPQYTVHSFTHEDISVEKGAKVVDRTGFKKPFTAEKLEENLLFIPREDNGNYRASASKFISGDLKGFWSFLDRREENPVDEVLHQDRREVRALVVFSSWLNNFDVRESNTLDTVITEKGQKVLRHYLIDFSASLGSAAGGAKPPMMTHEHLFDYGEIAKSFVSLGLRKKDWEKRLEMNEEIGERSPAVGYFDNLYFDPEKFKEQLPYYAFKNVSRADGFWAAKIIRSFSDEDIRAMVASGEYSNQEDADYISDVLIERRDMIAKYWFGESAPLDNFKFQNNHLSFEDLSVKYGFEQAASTTYHVEIVQVNGSKKKRAHRFATSDSSFAIDPDWSSSGQVDIFIRVSRNGEDLSPYVLVSVESDNLTGIRHQD
jgi:hypothetical protein